MTSIERWMVAAVAIATVGCDQPPPAETVTEAAEAPEPTEAPSNVPPLDPTNLVRIASDSPDHTTLVAAIKAADYVTPVAASGPLTVFAPTNAAFDALPEGTVATLLEPDNVDQLRDVLQYHVTTSALDAASFRDGQVLAMANGGKVTVSVPEPGKVRVNGASVTASIRGSNGIIHVVDAVLLPPDEG